MYVFSKTACVCQRAYTAKNKVPPRFSIFGTLTAHIMTKCLSSFLEMRKTKDTVEDMSHF